METWETTVVYVTVAAAAVLAVRHFYLVLTGRKKSCSECTLRCAMQADTHKKVCSGGKDITHAPDTDNQAL